MTGARNASRLGPGVPNDDPGPYVNEGLAALEENRRTALCLPP
ncbi:MAG TPA: hypothetical protein VGE51_09225 [Fontimonas sp.]